MQVETSGGKFRLQLHKYDDAKIRRGEYGDQLPYFNVPTSRLVEDVKLGQRGLVEALEKGAAVQFADGRIVLNTEVHPFYSDPLTNVRGLMTAPRIAWSNPGDTTTQLIPVHPMDAIQKATLTTGDTGAYNAIFGAVAVSQVAIQQNVFAALPKRPYMKEGFRAVSALGTISTPGIAEGASVPTAIEPTYQEITVGMKDWAVATEMSTRLELVSTKNDTVTFGGNAQIIFANFLNALDTWLLKDTNTLASYAPESLDRITCSSAGSVACGNTANDEDLYGVDRSSDTWFNGNMDHNSDTDRSLTIGYIDALIRDQWKYWGADTGSNKLWITHPSTWVPWSALEGSKQRFSQETASYTYTQGVQPVTGQAGGFKLSTYNNYPIVLDANVVEDTIGRIYLLDTNHVGLVIGRPIEAIQANNPVYLGSFVNRVVFYGIGETWCDLPLSQGQLRDLA
jgi:hypothetical protein